ncbi:MAG: hypothetical protein ABI580_13485, partial [Burkholderiaceae bacterium]
MGMGFDGARRLTIRFRRLMPGGLPVAALARLTLRRTARSCALRAISLPAFILISLAALSHDRFSALVR